MSQFNDTGYGSLTLTDTVRQYARVQLNGSQSAGNQTHFGFACQSGVAGDAISVAYVSKQGTVKAIAAGAIPVGTGVYTASNGEVNDTQATGAFFCGVAITAAAADQDVIEILPMQRGEPGA